MSLDPFFYFDGDCRAAVEFYAATFQLEMPTEIMTYDQNPGDEISEENRGRIMYTTLPIFDHNVMLSDIPAGSPYQKGGNIALTLGTPDKAEVERLFNALAQDGTIDMPLSQTFFSELYGMLTDKFGIRWQLSATPFAE